MDSITSSSYIHWFLLRTMRKPGRSWCVLNTLPTPAVSTWDYSNTQTQIQVLPADLPRTRKCLPDAQLIESLLGSFWFHLSNRILPWRWDRQIISVLAKSVLHSLNLTNSQIWDWGRFSLPVTPPSAFGYSCLAPSQPGWDSRINGLIS